MIKITQRKVKKVNVSPENDKMGIEAPALALVSGDDGSHLVPGLGHQELARGGDPAMCVMSAVVTCV